MALPAPDETLLGVTQYRPRKKQAPVVPVRVERRAPPKVLNKPGTTEWVGTQKPTEQQKPETELTIDAPPDLSQYLHSKLGDDLTKVELYKIVEARKEYDAKYSAAAIAAKKRYNDSVRTYNQAIGHKTPEQNKAIADRLLKKTQPKTVMA